MSHCRPPTPMSVSLPALMLSCCCHSSGLYRMLVRGLYANAGEAPLLQEAKLRDTLDWLTLAAANLRTS